MRRQQEVFASLWMRAIADSPWQSEAIPTRSREETMESSARTDRGSKNAERLSAFNVIDERGPNDGTEGKQVTDLPGTRRRSAGIEVVYLGGCVLIQPRLQD